jgi:hypothetical protein
MAKKEALERLVAEVRKDPNLFHAIVFNPDSVINKLDFLDRREKGQIVSMKPEDLVAGLIGVVTTPGGNVAECGSSCGGSCNGTCDGSCGGTCASSCDATCGGGSCGVTSNRPGVDIFELVSHPEDFRTQFKSFANRSLFRSR